MTANTKVLREFSRWCAAQVLHLWNPQEVVVQYMYSGNEILREQAYQSALRANVHYEPAILAAINATRFDVCEITTAVCSEYAREALSNLDADSLRAQYAAKLEQLTKEESA
jgi:hypothetical protein